MTKMKYGTRIETHGMPAFPGFPGVSPERARIMKPRKGESVPTHAGPGWHLVQFDSDGGRLCMHESRFRVIDNRA